MQLNLGQAAPKEDSEDHLANCCLAKTTLFILPQMDLALNRAFALKCLWQTETFNSLTKQDERNNFFLLFHDSAAVYELKLRKD